MTAFPANSVAPLTRHLSSEYGSRVVPIPLPMELSRWKRALLIPGGLLAVALISWLDVQTGPDLSFALIYLIPVAACAWWGGSPHGVLLSLGAALAWHLIDGTENPAMQFSAEAWNGAIRFGTLALISSLISRLHAGVLRERLLARTDSLTGAANGRTFYETASTEARRATRTGRPLTLAYLDLDNFKQLNDRMGHAAGDEALVYVVHLARLHSRDTDLLARLGGDEFALLLPETDAEGALTLLTRLQETVSEEMAYRGWAVTLSVGAVTFLHPPTDVDQMVQCVDGVMYRAKHKGKGRVEHALSVGGQFLPPVGTVERRATVRIFCSLQVRVRREGVDARPLFATLIDLSLGGVCVHLEGRFPPDTLLVIEPLSPESRTLMARVVRADAAIGGGWRHGCELSRWLNIDELRAWVGPPQTQAV